jgi:OmpA-OmpF porin, OOP family
MKLPIRIKERVIGAALVMILFIGTGIFSCMAQSPVIINPFSKDEQINHASEINTQAKSTAIKMINSPYEELKPALAPCGKKLYFSRFAHPENASNSKNDNEDIWYASYNDETKVWSSAIRLSGVLNNKGHNYVNSISYNGDTIILGNKYLKNGKMKAGLSYSVNMGGQWTAPKSIKIKNDYNMSNQANAYVSLKTGVIISAIQRLETKGGRDLYVSFWDGAEATEPINMGAVINTNMEESSPYLASDNKTLYFASKGHNGYGGFDIFVTERLDETWTNWSEPRNLGQAVNGLLDDEHFSISHCGNYGVFSKQISVHNVDLFSVSIDDLLPMTTIAKKKINFNGKEALAALMDNE